FTASSQEWAPAGAKWHYTEYFFGPSNILEGFMTIEAAGDTVIAGHLCRKLIKTDPPGCMDRPAVEFTYAENDKVYFYDHGFATFQVLYDFGANAGDSWTILVKDMFPPDDVDTLIVRVDSATQTTINGVSLRKLYVFYHFHNELNPGYLYPGVIIQSVGDLQYMFNWYPQWAFGCDANFSGGLRCYQDPAIGLYETGLADSCEYVKYWAGLGHRETDHIRVGPNPADDHLIVTRDSRIPLVYRISDRTGACLLSAPLTGDRIPVGQLLPGLYVIEFYSPDHSFLSRQKIVIR
ncbi:MAG TPA: hypothetical protein PKG48_14330, partial [Bacteroidales bacterium]|nr:hypothetical protein [Bacteroidales bacterium]